ncbi:MAG: alpha/beta fold hydrolase [Pseudomonadota bacterium]
MAEAAVPATREGGPRPLLFHFGAAALAHAAALSAAVKPPPALPEALAGAAAGVRPEAIAAEAARRLALLSRGVAAWQAHPWRRVPAVRDVLWSEGSTRLLDHGGDGRPVLVVPSLVNRPDILDLAPGASLLAGLAAEGVRPVLVDWGAPEWEETRFGLDDYGARLAAALAALTRLAGAPVPVLGYCMGGTLATGLAAARPGEVAALALIGAPWSFGTDVVPAERLRAFRRALGPGPAREGFDAVLTAFGALPVDLLQLFFALHDPPLAARKFRAFARLDPESPRARLFVAVEDWLNDGQPLAAGAAREVVGGWYLADRPARGRWRFLGERIRPDTLTVPALAVCASADRIAPPASTEPLAKAIPGARILRPATGHVGMIIGGGARGALWSHLAEFLRDAGQ